MCPIETPEGPNIGLIGSLGSYATVNEFGFIQTPYRRVVNGKVTAEVERLDATQEEHKIIAQANAEIDAKGKLVGQVLCRKGGEPILADPADVEYMDVSPAADRLGGDGADPVPRAQRRQPRPDGREHAAPGGAADDHRGPAGGHRHRAPRGGGHRRRRASAAPPGTVAAVDADHIIVEDPQGELEHYELHKFTRSNQGTLIHQKPIVRKGQVVEQGDVLADGSSTDNGELALGSNVLVAFMSWEGYNFEDAIIISERLVKDDVLSSIHIEAYEIDARTTKLGAEEITRDIPNRSEESLKDLDEQRHRAHRRRGHLRRPPGRQGHAEGRDRAHGRGEADPRHLQGEGRRGPRHLPEGARTARAARSSTSRSSAATSGDDLSPGVNQLVRVYVAKRRKIAEGDKLAGRHGNKGVISKIVPEEDMPFLEDGTPIDMILNPLGVPSRMNIGQILETHLGWAAAPRMGGRRLRRRGSTARPPSGPSWPRRCSTAPRRRTWTGCSWTGQASHPENPIQLSIDETDRPGRRRSGRMKLYNGRTGEPYEGKVTVGYMYMLKLLHLVDDKIHARSTGPYSLVTQQPLGGKAQFGGQRFGEMEVWALEAYGAAYTLQEMLTIKSDDTVGRVKAYEAIVKGENIQEPSIPESFKVLLKEMQSLGLDVKVEGEAGPQFSARDEDDDLLRAAEELGHRPLGRSRGRGAEDDGQEAGGGRRRAGGGGGRGLLGRGVGLRRDQRLAGPGGPGA